MENGLVHIYCGNGKGKTTASIGLAVRCKGRGFKVLYCCFLKNTCSGEHSVMQNIDIQKCDFFDKFCFCMNEKESAVAKEKTKEYFEQAISKAKNYDMIILDEILDAVDMKYIEECELVKFLKEKPAGLEVVLTGRYAGENIQNEADYISEIKCIKHPYNQGIGARYGIEM